MGVPAWSHKGSFINDVTHVGGRGGVDLGVTWCDKGGGRGGGQSVTSHIFHKNKENLIYI